MRRSVKHEITDPAQREKLLALAAFPTLQYEAKREPVAKELGVRKGALDTVVEQLRIALAIDSGEGIDACDAKAGALDMLLAIGDEVELFRAAGEDGTRARRLCAGAPERPCRGPPRHVGLVQSMAPPRVVCPTWQGCLFRSLANRHRNTDWQGHVRP